MLRTSAANSGGPGNGPIFVVVPMKYPASGLND
jgi:hypothetical protein